MNYTLIRTKRKTCEIRILEGSVVVRAPIKMPKLDIEQLLEEKSSWIARHLEETEEFKKKRSVFCLQYGSKIRYRGRYLPIQAVKKNSFGFDNKGFYMTEGMEPNQIMQICEKIYKNCAMKVLTERVRYFSKIMDVQPVSVKINSARTRWGSCSAKGNLNFSWKLMMADDSAIDYVVVHELAHLKEMNHSAKFWAEVERLIPERKKMQKKLLILQKKLREETWE